MENSQTFYPRVLSLPSLRRLPLSPPTPPTHTLGLNLGPPVAPLSSGGRPCWTPFLVVSRFWPRFSLQSKIPASRTSSVSKRMLLPSNLSSRNGRLLHMSPRPYLLLWPTSTLPTYQVTTTTMTMLCVFRPKPSW